MNMRKIHLEHHIYTIWTSQNITQNITCILSEHHKIYHKTSYVYHVNIRKIHLEHHIYTMWTSQNKRTSHVYYLNITKIQYRTSHVYYVSITYILCEHHKIHQRTHKIHHRTSSVYYVNITKNIVEHDMHTMQISQNITQNIIRILREHHVYITCASQNT
jgi:hypothetical protein